MSDLEYSVQDHVATIVMNRPERKNAISPEMHKLWKEHFAAAQKMLSESGLSMPFSTTKN